MYPDPNLEKKASPRDAIRWAPIVDPVSSVDPTRPRTGPAVIETSSPEPAGEKPQIILKAKGWVEMPYP